jgi:tRNA threonylcarbamoyladenosine biosynthesis protein TsaE
MEFNTKNAGETEVAGKAFANHLIISGAKKATVALIGELGSGKTTFVQGFAKRLRIKKRIISPTFVIMRKYDIDKGLSKNRLVDLYHIDLYRISGNFEKEIKNLGLEELWQNDGNIILIEWADKIKQFLPKRTHWLNFDILSGSERNIKILQK